MESCQQLMSQVNALDRDQLLQTYKFLDLSGYDAVAELENNAPPLLIIENNHHLIRDEIDEMDDQGVESFKQLEDFLKIFVPEAQPSSISTRSWRTTTQC